MRGFTLPVWVAAAAQSAAQVLSGNDFESEQRIDFPDDHKSIVVTVRSASVLDRGEKSIGICNCDPGECLDITRNLEIWTCLEYVAIDENSNSPYVDMTELNNLLNSISLKKL